MLIFNNLLINKNSDRFQPFLFNLLSGRRRLLNDDEVALVVSMAEKDGPHAFSEAEANLYNQLIREKQFLTDEQRRFFEAKLTESGYFDIKSKYADDYSFSVELTRACNMQCSYCYVGSRLNDGRSMTKEHIDAIYEFYRTYADDESKIVKTPLIRITGGEPLVNRETAGLINYLASRWVNAKLILFTNGVNLLKYYDALPLARIEEVHVSLDGVKDVHMERRYSGGKRDDAIYDNIIAGVQQLLADGIKVKIKPILDKTNYIRFRDFHEFLAAKGILDSPNCELLPGIVVDFRHPLDISPEHNSEEDIVKIQRYMESFDCAAPTFPSFTTLLKVLGRPVNEPYKPEHQRCNGRFLSNYYFSCNGKVYFCDCINENDGVVGTYFPGISIDEAAVSGLLNRSVMRIEKCKSCAYKFICLGGCPLAARTKNEEVSCGIFADENILDNLEFDYNRARHSGYQRRSETEGAV